MFRKVWRRRHPSLPKTPKKVVRKPPISVLNEEENCGWDNDNGVLVVADSYDGDGDGDDKDVDEEDAPSSSINKRIVDGVLINPEDYPQLGMFLRLNYLDEELQKKWTVVGKENAAMLQQQWVQIMTKQMDLAADRMDVVEDGWVLNSGRVILSALFLSF